MIRPVLQDPGEDHRVWICTDLMNWSVMISLYFLKGMGVLVGCAEFIKGGYIFSFMSTVFHYPISFGQKSWCNLRWPADLQRALCKDCSILQVCIAQHQKDQILSDGACCKTSCPGPCHFQAGLLQCSSGWTSIKQSNLYKWFRMQWHSWSSTSPKEPMLHLSLSNEERSIHSFLVSLNTLQMKH